MTRLTLIIAILVSITTQVSSFTLGTPRQLFCRMESGKLTKLYLENNDDDYTGEVDWDAEWKKVVENKDRDIERPGKDFYKTDVEKAAIKATRDVQERVIDVRKTIAENPSIQTPDIKSLQGDGRFWIAILAIISVGIALVGASSQQSYTNDSFYI